MKKDNNSTNNLIKHLDYGIIAVSQHINDILIYNRLKSK